MNGVRREPMGTVIVVVMGHLMEYVVGLVMGNQYCYSDRASLFVGRYVGQFMGRDLVYGSSHNRTSLLMGRNMGRFVAGDMV